MRSADQIENREAHSTAGVDAGRVLEGVSAGQLGGPGSVWGRTRRHRWLLRLFPFPVMLSVLLITLQFIMSHQNISDPDIWWHLRNAEYLFQHHQLPRYDQYSFTAEGHAWINHEWLAEVPYYLAWRGGGLSGLNVLMFAIINLIFLGLLYLCYKESANFKAAIVACCFSTFLASVSFGPRTILFGYAYLLVLLIILQRFRREGRAALWLIPPLFCLWVNTHGSWLLGLVIFSIIAAAGLVQGRWGRVETEPWTPSQFHKLAVTWVMSVAALFVNPFGYRLVLYPFDLAFRQKLNIAHVEEWVSVNFHEPRGKLVLILLVTLLLSALLRSHRWNLAELSVVLFALYSGLTHIRFLFLLGIVVAPVLAKILDFVPPYRAEIDTPLINALAIFLMVAGMVHYWPTSAKLRGLVEQQYPAEILPYLRAHPPAGPMLNFYLWGGYLGWNDRNVKLFVDSRVDIFEYTGVFKDYIDLLELKQPKSLLDKYKIRYVLFPHSEPLTYALEHDPEWKALYNGQISVLLERVGEASNGATEKLRSGHP